MLAQPSELPQGLSHQKSQSSIGEQKTLARVPPSLCDIRDELYTYVRQLGITSEADLAQIDHFTSHALSFSSNLDDSGPLPEPLANRVYDAPRLRDIRKNLDADQLSQLEIEELALLMLDELPELASDYLGNTVVQKLFEQCESDAVRTMMLKQVAPYLSQMGVHKNGTWAAQKMVAVSRTLIQKNVIAGSLADYAVPLFNDQFGNYVLQCCLKFGSPYNDFIFVAIMAHFWLISQGRFGARSVRACLESDAATPVQTALVAVIIVMSAEFLATDANGALLVTWFLDTCTLAQRHTILAPRLAPHLGDLCTHKLASLTVLKVVNNRIDLGARDLLLDALFGPEGDNVAPPVLHRILLDSASHGASFVYKVLSTPSLEGSLRQHVVTQVRRVLMELSANLSSFQGYKRLLEEVGLSARMNSGATQHQRSYSSNAVPRISTARISTSPTRIPEAGFKNYQRPPYVPAQMNYPSALYQPRYVNELPQSRYQNDFPQPRYQGELQPQYESQPQYQKGFPPSQFQQPYPGQPQDVMQQLEQLSLSSAALGYSLPGSPASKNQNLGFSM
ncbi:hypothetical protein BABINDRAFT_34794 [Babjeviella inositovora NRRL Y-12698]|uniref:PUM-HD domain-containing protein n=1 Tax=Babjeviella inositovora NRRL Y-12698 TaxID=984486 RepID=A0A1E3QUJ7_9ASCO|nr:uncharacterized protein BABINDRAFT_34794 [Babjeviella inositovora NRRL Y-12698]ODQ80627.1 hypothetical protein BABINDRAFT_34794 [Babjeviella inositovora NRRL Y-12698]